jgi:hypothetical protein
MRSQLVTALFLAAWTVVVLVAYAVITVANAIRGARSSLGGTSD